MGNQKYIVDEDFINCVLSNYHKIMLNNEGMGLEWNNRKDFINSEFRKGLKRKNYYKIKMYKEPHV